MHIRDENYDVDRNYDREPMDYYNCNHSGDGWSNGNNGYQNGDGASSTYDSMNGVNTISNNIDSQIHSEDVATVWWFIIESSNL